MLILDRYLLREILLPFFYALLVLVFVLLMGQLFKIVNMVVSEGVRIGDVGLLVLALIPKLLTMALPISFFFAVIAGVGRMVDDGEIIALKAAGISPRRLLTPVLYLAAFCTLMTILVSAWLAPWGLRQVREITFKILKEKMTVALQARSLNLAFPGMVIYIGDIDHESGRVADVFIEDQRRPETPQMVTAVRGRIVSDRNSSSLLLQLEEGTIHEYDQRGEAYRVTDFSQYRINFEIAALLGDESFLRQKNKDMTTSKLLRKIAQRKSLGESPVSAQVVLYERFIQPFAGLVFALLGLALALVPVRSSARFQGFVYGLLLLLAYYIFVLLCEYLTEWRSSLGLLFFLLPNFFFLGLGWWLLYLRQHERELFSGFEPAVFLRPALEFFRRWRV
ncbi:MAG TPA: LPS export ABC transporter permease LptF [Proteobacteria bacterium]|nr:LPS export ABC transporter permease LptF [Pseudomonadota bacterium]